MNIKNTKEINHFTKLKHIWWGAKTVAGQKRYDLKTKQFIRYCKPNSRSKILEIGCGDGEFTRRILKYSNSVTGIDITPAVIQRARKESKNKKVKFMVDNCEKLSFKDQSFDIVCGISILHHVNTRKTLKEIYRVLKSGGKFFFTEPNYLNPNIFFGLNIPIFRKWMEYSPDEVAFVRHNLRKLIKKIGFKKIVVKNYDFLHPLTPKRYINSIIKLSSVLENIPMIKEISGSLIVNGEKP